MQKAELRKWVRGTCYPDAVKAARRMGDTATVIHGKVWQPTQRREALDDWLRHGGSLPEAWIAFPEGIAEAQYRKLLKPKPAKRYDKYQAIALAMRHGHWGPWD